MFVDVCLLQMFFCSDGCRCCFFRWLSFSPNSVSNLLNKNVLVGKATFNVGMFGSTLAS